MVEAQLDSAVMEKMHTRMFAGQRNKTVSLVFLAFLLKQVFPSLGKIIYNCTEEADSRFCHWSVRYTQTFAQIQLPQHTKSMCCVQ